MGTFLQLHQRRPLRSLIRLFPLRVGLTPQDSFGVAIFRAKSTL